MGIVVLIPCVTGHADDDEGPGEHLPTDYFHGLDFGPYVGGAAPGGGDLPTGQLETQLDLVSPHVQWVRTYGAAENLQEIPRMATDRGLSVAMGTWIVDYGGGERETELAELVAKAKAGWVDLAVVGNEELVNLRETGPSLSELLRRVRADLDANGAHDVPVTVAEPYGNWALEQPDSLWRRDGNGQLVNWEVLETVDEVILVNIYPFHERVDISQAVATLAELYFEVDQIVNTELSLNKEVIIAETGWPTEGETKGLAVPSHENARRYLIESVGWAKRNNIPLFYFATFDEEWKGPEEYEKHFGVWDADGGLKIGLHRGDADGDNDVDFDDFLDLQIGWGPGTGKVWSQGDFDSDGDVDYGDFESLRDNWTGGGVETVPAPTALWLLVFGAALAARRRKVAAA